MRIALLSYEYPPDTGFGGIGTYTWYQARALTRLGHHVRVIAGSLEHGVYHSEQDGVSITRVLDEGSYGGAVKGLHEEGLGWASVRVRNAASAFGALRDLLQHESFDMVEYPECGGDGILISTLLPVRTCVRFHSPARLIMESYGAPEQDLDVTTFFEQIAINQADILTSPSSFLADEVRARLGVSAPVHVVPNGIDLELFDSVPEADVAERFGLPTTDAVTILFSNRLEQRKGVHLLGDIFLEILRTYPQVHVVVAGADPDGVLERTVRPRLEDHGIAERLHAVGWLGLDDIRAVGKHVDIHLLPTLWDNAPYSCLEAMAAGRAVIASDCGGIPELIDHEGNGLLATTDDADAFVAGLSRLIEDRALRERLGASARQTVEERYTDTAMARRTVEVWQQSIAAEASMVTPDAQREAPASATSTQPRVSSPVGTRPADAAATVRAMGRRGVRRLVPRGPVRKVRSLIRREVALAQPPAHLPSPPAPDGIEAARAVLPPMIELLGRPDLVNAAVVSEPEQVDLAFPPFAPRSRTGDELPLPPQEYWTVAEEFLESGERDARRIVEVIKLAGMQLRAGSRVLDFGCGPGRVLRWMPAEIDGWGADINADVIAWCQSALSPPHRFLPVSLHPHLPFSDGHFDLVYAGSVFTHLSEMADTWLLELLRITRPGGLLYLTIHDQHSVGWCRTKDPENPLRALTGWDAPAERQEFFAAAADRLGGDLEGFTIGRAYLSQVFYDRSALLAHWGRYAEVVDVVPGAFALHQTAVVMRSPIDESDSSTSGIEPSSIET